MLIGIVAEYNPFHDGHLFHIEETKKTLGNAADVVVVLSANFVQRGLPAFCDKWARTQMALENGVALVVELPTFFSCAGGQLFAAGAVDILNAVGVSHISFGVEENNKSHFMLNAAASILTEEPDTFKQSLKRALKNGSSYSKAIAAALEHEHAGLGDFASQPNNSLAISYLSHIKKKNYQIEAIPITRRGLGHHASASAIRKELCSEKNFDRLWQLVRFFLLSNHEKNGKNLKNFGADGIENLLAKNALVADSFDDFVGKCVCAKYTRSRIQRQTIRAMLGIDRWTEAALTRVGAPYVRVLGYNDEGRKILRGMKTNLEVVTRLAAVRGKLGRKVAEIEFRASRLWEMLVEGGDLAREKNSKPKIISHISPPSHSESIPHRLVSL